MIEGWGSSIYRSRAGYLLPSPKNQHLAIWLCLAIAVFTLTRFSSEINARSATHSYGVSG